jgi:lipopolysaccharide export system protein LptA
MWYCAGPVPRAVKGSPTGSGIPNVNPASTSSHSAGLATDKKGQDSLIKIAVSDTNFMQGDSSTVFDSSAVSGGSLKSAKIKPESKKPPKPDIPLICQANPGSAEGSGIRGEYILSGNVHCNYGKLKFKTSKATWNRAENAVMCEGEMEVSLNKFSLNAQTGGYNKSQDMAWARHNVIGYDTTGDHLFSAGYLTYHRNEFQMLLKENPVLKKIYRDSVKKSSLNPEGASKKMDVDTLFIRGDEIAYNDSTNFAVARRNVNIKRGNFIITCDSAYFNENDEKITFLGSPVLKLLNDKMRGDTMVMYLDGEQVKSLSLKGQAAGDYEDKPKDSPYKDTYHIEGDSLWMNFSSEDIEDIEVFRQALSTYSKSNFPEQKDELTGDYVNIKFKDRAIDKAKVFGSAQSIYFHMEGKKLSGKNVAAGDSMEIQFDNGKVQDIRVSGKASGTFFGAPQKQQTDTTNNLKVE